MRTTLLSVILALFFIMPPCGAAAQKLSFEEIVDNLDQAKQTSLHVKMYWQENQGRDVTWTGVVSNVKGGRSRAEIYVANRARQTYKGFNIVLETFDLQRAAQLKIGDTIRFTGRLNNYKGRRGRPVVVYLTEVQVQ